MLSAASHARGLWLGEAASLGLAPLHALTIGYLGATLLAMITRVAAGHSGRALAADDLAWTLYLLLQTAVVLRLVAALWPAAMEPLTQVAVRRGPPPAPAGRGALVDGWAGRASTDDPAVPGAIARLGH